MTESQTTTLLYDRYYTTVFGRYGLLDVQKIFRGHAKAYRQLLPQADPNLPVLDFGAGLGLTVLWLKKQGFQAVSGIDMSKEQCQVAKTQYGAVVEHVAEPLDYLEHKKGAFGLITMIDVIEHIPKHSILEYLVALREALRPGGRLIVRTDNMSSPIGAYQYRMDFTHEYCFTEASLRQVLLCAGFQSVTIRGDPPIIGRRLHGWKGVLIRPIWWWILRQLYDAERPYSENPRIFSKSLIACADKAAQ